MMFYARKPLAATAMVSVVLGMTKLPPAFGADSVSDLTGPWHLFIDDYAVAGRTDLVRTYHAFQKYAANPVMVADRAWEGANIYLYGTVLPNETGPGYRMWYHSLDLGVAARALYATSLDGIVWTKPNLGIVSYAGSTNNNILVPTGSFPSVMHTPWDADIQRTYKLIRYQSGRFYGSWATDAIHWTDSPANPVVPPAGDVGNFVWDPHTQRYLGYPKVAGFLNGTQRRSVGYTTTPDFESWPAASLILTPDAFDDRWTTPGLDQRTHFYGLSAFAYEKGYVGLLWILRSYEKISGADNGPIFIEIVSSPDGIHWTREEGDRPPILPVGPANAWDDGMIVTSTHPIVEGDTLRLYYGGFDGLHAEERSWHAGIGLATLRKDGFASLDAAYMIGTVTTQRLDFASGPLRVNYAAGATGWLRAEVLDEAGNVWPGYGLAECATLTGDHVDQTVTWALHTELPAGAGPIRLRFTLQNASLYSFAAGDSARVIEYPSVTRQPEAAQVEPNGTATFSILARGTRTLRYQWTRDGRDLTDGANVTGATTATLTVAGVGADDVGRYRCIVTNDYGRTVSGEALLRLLTAEFRGIGTLPGASTSTVTGVTADGSVVCGATENRAFLWTSANGIVDLGVPAGATTSSAAGVGILNGSVVVAVNTNAATFKAQRWDGNTLGVGTYSGLPRMGGTLEWLAKGLGTNATSNVWIAGSSFDGGDGNGRQAGLYAQSGGTTSLLGLPANGHDHSDANAVADNGYIAGQYQFKGTAPTGGARNAMRSAGTLTCTALNSLLGAPSTSYEALAKAISRDGLAQAGWSHYSGGGAYSQPVIWRNSTTPTAISFLSGGDGDNHGEALAVNGDGSMAGGYSYRAGITPVGPKEAFLWDTRYGTRQFLGVLTGQYGADLTGWSLQEIRAISADGRVIAGNGTHNAASEGWVALFSALGPGPQADFDRDSDVDLADFASFQTCFNGPNRPANGGDCGGADLDYDGDVDLVDFSAFQTCFNGPNRPPLCG